ncbi:MAG: SagB/ThcOx family dehydrogenase [Clostridiales bacterium]|nr:SagB/ThcOx family dehydrogenase [Clostridiales bacterium]
MNEVIKNEIIKNGRAMLKPSWDEWDNTQTDMQKGLPIPTLGTAEGKLIPLADFSALKKQSLSLIDCIQNRRSARKYSPAPLTFEELSYLVWAACGVSEVRKGTPLRTYASGGNTQALNAYIWADNVTGLTKGLYRHMPLENGLVFIGGEERREQLYAAYQAFNAQTVFIWTAVPYRTEYRYSTVTHKMIAMEAGHACQNLYLAAESLGMGCVAIAAYSQKNADKLLNLPDPEEEFVIYMAAAGRVAE